MHQIYVKDMQGKTITIDVDDILSTTGLALKQQILQKEGIPIDIQRLVVSGLEWQNESTVRDLGPWEHARPDIRPYLVLRRQKINQELRETNEAGAPNKELTQLPVTPQSRAKSTNYAFLMKMLSTAAFLSGSALFIASIALSNILMGSIGGALLVTYALTHGLFVKPRSSEKKQNDEPLVNQIPSIG